jgi:hypothetical protein
MNIYATKMTLTILNALFPLSVYGEGELNGDECPLNASGVRVIH